jgi:hypothetical protein
MTTFLNTVSPLDQLDHELTELTREHGHVLDVSHFRRHLGTADWRAALQSAGPADTLSASRSESQLRQELNLAFTDLGALAHHSKATDPRLAPCVQHIHNLYAQLDAITHADCAGRRP